MPYIEQCEDNYGSVCVWTKTGHYMSDNEDDDAEPDKDDDQEE